MTEVRANTSDSMRTSRDKRTITPFMLKKLAIIVVMILLALFALIIKLYLIQSRNSETYNQKILSQQKYDSREIPYRRGDITDRNGTYLATSTKVYNLIIDPSQINSDQDDYLEPTVSLLSEVFGMDPSEIRNTVYERSDSQYIRLAKQISFEQKENFELRKDEINSTYKTQGDTHRVYGVWFEDSYMRYYPNNSLACNVIGFAVSDNTLGSGGIEQYYNDKLIGVSGREYGYLNDDSNLERVTKQPHDGYTIVSTIDVNIQSIVEKYIDGFQNETGSKTCACIVLEPDTGEVLAMASNRRFDLNNPRDISQYYPTEEYESFTTQEKSDALNSIWRNFCISDTFEPGSTSKIFTVATALEEKKVSPGDTYFCDGYEEVSGRTIKCNKLDGHGNLNLEQSLMQSCNDAMMQIVAKVGKSDFCKYQSIFGFGSKTGIDLPGEANTSSLVFEPQNMVDSDLATNSFGQNYNCTMIQMASAYASVINGGSYYEPHIVKQILNSEGSLLEEMEPKLVTQTVSASTADFIKKSLFDTVISGTGSAAVIKGYEIAGKTGTAEKYPRKNGNYLVSFCGFAPASDPEVLVYVVVDEPNVEDQAHSSFATIVFRNIMNDILPYMNIFKEGEFIDELNEKDKEENINKSESIQKNSESKSDSGNNKKNDTPKETQPETTFASEEVIEREAVPDGEDEEYLPGAPPNIDRIEEVTQVPPLAF